MSLGLNKGDRVALISKSRNDWVVSEMGILYCGAINVPISIKHGESERPQVPLNHSGCRFVDRLARPGGKNPKDQERPPQLEKVIVLDELKSFESDEIYAGDILTAGSPCRPRPGSLRRALAVRPGIGYANICYTSGTTADPKGIILTTATTRPTAEQSLDLVRCEEDWLSLIILPWDHAFAHTCGVYTLMMRGAAWPRSRPARRAWKRCATSPSISRKPGPTFSSASLPWPRASGRTSRRACGRRPEVEALFRKALKAAVAYNAEGCNPGPRPAGPEKPLVLLYDKILFSKIRENFGGRLQFFVGGGALLDIELQRFFYALGIPMFRATVSPRPPRSLGQQRRGP